MVKSLAHGWIDDSLMVKWLNTVDNRYLATDGLSFSSGGKCWENGKNNWCLTMLATIVV